MVYTILYVLIGKILNRSIIFDKEDLNIYLKNNFRAINCV